MSLTEFHIDFEGDFSKLKNTEHSTQSRSAATVEPPHVFRDFYLMAFGHASAVTRSLVVRNVVQTLALWRGVVPVEELKV